MPTKKMNPMDQPEHLLISFSVSLRDHMFLYKLWSFLFLLSSLNAVKESFVDVLAALTHILLMVLLKTHCINSQIMSS